MKDMIAFKALVVEKFVSFGKYSEGYAVLEGHEARMVVCARNRLSLDAPCLAASLLERRTAVSRRDA